MNGHNYKWVHFFLQLSNLVGRVAQQVLSDGARRVERAQVGLHALEEVHESEGEVDQRRHDGREEVVARGAAVDDREEADGAEHEAEHGAGHAERAAVRAVARRLLEPQADERRELERVRHERADERQVDQHRAQTRVADDVVQRDGQHEAADAACDERHVGRAARRVHRREHAGQEAVARDSEQQLAHAEHKRVEAADEPDNQQPREARRRAVVAEDRLVAVQQRRRGRSDGRGAGADHRVEDGRAEREHDERGDGRDESDGHVPGRLDGLLHRERQLLNAQVEPEREGQALDGAVPAVRVLHVLGHDPLVVRDVGDGRDVEDQQQQHREQRGHELDAERHFDAQHVERHEDDVEDGPPERAQRVVRAQQLVQVRPDADDHDGAGRDDLERLGQAGEEGRTRADAVQREHVRAAARGQHGGQLGDGEREQHVEHGHERQDDEQAVEAGDESGLPAEEVARDDGADTQSPEVRRLGVAVRSVGHGGRRRSLGEKPRELRPADVVVTRTGCGHCLGLLGTVYTRSAGSYLRILRFKKE